MKHPVTKVIINTVKKHWLLSSGLITGIVISIVMGLIPPLLLEDIVNSLGDLSYPWIKMALIYFVVVAISGLADSLKEIIIAAFGQKITHELRSIMALKLSRLSSGKLTSLDQGETASRFVNDVNTVENLFTSGIISMIADLCRLISIMFIIYSRSTGLFVVLLIITPLLFILTRVFQKRMLKAQLKNREAVAMTTQLIPESLRNMRTIRMLKAQRFMEEHYDRSIEKSFEAQEESSFYDSIYSPIIICSGSLIIGIMMASSSLNGVIQNFFGMSAGTAAALIAYVGSFFTPLESIGMEIQNIQSAIAGVRRINEFLEYEEKPQSSGKYSNDEYAVVADHISFGYESDNKLFNDYSLMIHEGESVVIKGRTGAGKSTLIKLMAGLYEPFQGEIRLFGRCARDIEESEKRYIFGYVEQQFHMIPGTIADEISLGNPDISEDMIMDALRMTGLDDVISSLPMGIHTICDESLFSEGQLQLLSIARATVCNPRILFLDEITASLDSNTEAMVLKALKEASKNRTSISVSHRLSASELSDNARVINI